MDTGMQMRILNTTWPSCSNSRQPLTLATPPLLCLDLSPANFRSEGALGTPKHPRRLEGALPQRLK